MVDFNEIQKYISKREEYLSNHLIQSKEYDFNLNAIFSAFDKNFDGKISRNEFRQVSKEQYSIFLNQLKEYNTKNGNNISDKDLLSYEQLGSMLEDAFITLDEVDNYKKGIESKNTDFSGAKNLEEKHDLKDINQMSTEEMKAELKTYGIDAESMNTRKIVNTLKSAREERIKSDINSDIIDGHIGTYSQGQSLYCTVLAQLDSLSDEEVAKIFNKEPKINSDGKKYWEVKFPCDDDSDRTVTVTEDELADKSIIVEDENGNPREVSDFPEGDLDVTLLTMAFVKRFGTSVTDNGAWAFQTKNKFISSKESKYMDNQHLENFSIDDFKNMPKSSSLNLLNKEELARKGIDTSGENTDLSWLSIQEQLTIGEVWGSFELENGIKGCYGKDGILLSDGTKIPSYHAHSVRGYDEETKELILSQSEYNNLSELRIPIELARFLETASTPNTPGVEQTPIPDIEP